MRSPDVCRRWPALLLALPLLVAAAEDAPATDLSDTREETGAAVAATDGATAAHVLELEAREAALHALERDLVQRIEELARLREQTAAIVDPESGRVDGEIQKLVKFYGSMKPKSAAELLEQLPLELAAEVLSSMKSRDAGKILNVMETARAVSISRRISKGNR